MRFPQVISAMFLVAWLSVAVNAETSAAPSASPTPSPSPTVSPARTESFFQMLMRIAGISATPRNQRNDNTRKVGQVWVAFLNNNTRARVRTADSGYRSPVFFPDGVSILALQGTNVVKLTISDGTKQTLFEVKGIIKLVGFDKNDPDKVLILSDEDQDACPTVGLLSLSSGTVAPQPYGRSEGDQVLLSSLEGWNREYDDGNFAVDSLVQVKRSGTQETKWMDVILMEKNKPDKNVSLCEPRNCSQPSMSNDRKRVVYIKEDE